MSNIINTFEVKNREDFIKLLDLFVTDLKQNKEHWENKSLEDFFEAFSSVTEDIQGYYDNMKLDLNSDVASWRLFADLFKSARIYE